MGGGKITKEDIIAALGYEPVGGQGINLLSIDKLKNHQYFTRTNDEKCGYKITLPYYNEQPAFQSENLWPNENIYSNGIYTLSFDAESDTAVKVSTDFFPDIYEFCESGAIQIDISNERKRYKLSGVLKSIETNENIFLRFWRYRSEPRTDIRISNVKFELGIAKDPIWTPAPEDYIALVERIAALEGKLAG